MNKVVLVVAVIFLGFWLMTDPRGLADTSSSLGSTGWGVTQQFFGAVIDFVGEIG